jgi:peptide/nickel transport system permease protein
MANPQAESRAELPSQSGSGSPSDVAISDLPADFTRFRTRRMRRLMRSNRLGLAGLVLVLIVLFFGLFGTWIIGQNPNSQSLIDRLQPFWTQSHDHLHVLGTDALGRDVFARLASGARASLTVAAAALVLGGGIGTVLGLIAGYKGGWLDTVIARLIDAQLALPNLVFAMIVSAVLGQGFTTTVIALGVSTWPTYARLIRGETLRIRKREFVEAAQLVGVSTPRVLVSHMLPNVINAAIVVASLELGRMILLESSLSFIGLGIQAPNASLGTMIHDAQPYIYNHWLLSAIPGLCIMVLVLGLNLLGDWIRDVLDPRS